MSENRKYYYLKLKENFFTSEKMVILESMQDGLLYSNLLLKMYLMSLKYNGILMLNDRLPHTPQTIATFTRHQVGTVERAIKVFMEFSLVEILTDGAFYMTDIQLLIGQSSTEGERKKKERMRLQHQHLLPSGAVDKCLPYSRGDICPPEIRDKRLDIRDKSIESETVPCARGIKIRRNAVFRQPLRHEACRLRDLSVVALPEVHIVEGHVHTRKVRRIGDVMNPAVVGNGRFVKIQHKNLLFCFFVFTI